MSCPRCTSDRLFQFEAPADLPVRPAELPAICRECGTVIVGGQAMSFPPGVELEAKESANRAAAEAQAAAAGLEEEPSRGRIERYFSRVYSRGFLDGFWRAYAYLRHHVKEGRLVRLRELWGDVRGGITVEGPPLSDGRPSGVMNLVMSTAEYNEFVYLLFLGTKEPPHAPGDQDQRSTFR